MSGRRLCGAIATVALAGSSMVALAGQGAAAASATALHPTVKAVVAFQADGARFAAWQGAGASAITVFDAQAADDRTFVPPTGCSLMRRGVLGAISTGAERFLLECGAGQAVLDARTGASTDLSRGLDGEYEWVSVGRLYAESRRKCSSGDCVAIENLRTGAVSLRRHFEVYDLSRAGAPAVNVCRAMRGALARALRIAEPGAFALSERLLALPTKNDEHVELVGCRGKPLVLRERAMPRDFQLGDGILTWDTGYPLRASAPEEALAGPAKLIGYRLSDGRREDWPLPNATVSGLSTIPGPFGFSAHAGATAFWVRATSVSGASGESTLYTGSV